MKFIHKFLVFGLMILTLGCATPIEIPKHVTYDYNVNVDLAALKTYNLRPIPTTVGIKPLMLERIVTAIHNELMFKNLTKTTDNPDFEIVMFGVRTRLFTTAWRGPDQDLIVEKGKLLLKFIDPKTNRVIWWAEARTILDPDMEPSETTEMVNDLVGRLLDKFPPASSS